MRSALGALAICGALAGCDAPPRYWVCDELPSRALHALPSTLSATGLFADMDSETLADGVLAYAPRWALWSDGAEKRRWIKLPTGARIDSTDMDHWVFPQGTQFWKEFTRDGVRVETRLLQKTGPHDDDWVGLAYVWDDDQREARAAPWGAIDVQGTPHNVPAASECMACHGGTKSRILGFSALQLAVDNDGPNLRTVSAQLLSNAPTSFVVAPPGDETTQAALGYLHANCSHCHNQQRPKHEGARCFAPDNELDFHLPVAPPSTSDETPTYQTMGSVVKRGHPDQSKLLDLVSHRGFFAQMPPLATERVDAQAVATLRAWIGSL